MPSGDAPITVSLRGLRAWAQEAHVPFTGSLRAERLQGGRSNEVLVVEDAMGPKVILRRPPEGSSGGLGRQTTREQVVLSALARAGLPVPRSYGLFWDPLQPDSPYHVLGYTEGVVLQGEADVQHLDAAAMLDIGGQFAEAAASLHAIDPESIGLGQISRRTDLPQRLMSRWRTEWEVGPTPVTGLANEVLDLLASRNPGQARVRLLHGDLRLSNIVFDPDGRLLTILDWELVTLGDPRVDLGFMLLNWCEDGEEPVFRGETVTRAAGFPDRAALMASYSSASGTEPERLGYFHALACWRLASQLLFLMKRDAAPAERAEQEDHMDAITLLIERAHLLLTHRLGSESDDVL